MRNNLRLLLIVCLAVIITACGNATSKKINVEMTDFAFTPNQFTVLAGEQIEVNVAHHGVVIHEFIIMKAGTSSGEKFDLADLPNVYWSIEVPPDHSHGFSFTAPAEPGQYQVLCGIAGHLQAGMVGTLTVVAQE